MLKKVLSKIKQPLSCGGDVVKCTTSPDATGYYACSIIDPYNNYGVKAELGNCIFNPLFYDKVVLPRTDHFPYNFSASCE